MFLQLILTYQMMSLTPGNENPENEDSLSQRIIAKQILNKKNCDTLT